MAKKKATKKPASLAKSGNSPKSAGRSKSAKAKPAKAQTAKRRATKAKSAKGKANAKTAKSSTAKSSSRKPSKKSPSSSSRQTGGQRKSTQPPVATREFTPTPAAPLVVPSESVAPTDSFALFSNLESVRGDIRLMPVTRQVAMARAKMALRSHLEEFQKLPGFQFADIGYKYVNGQPTESIAVRIHVDQKVDNAVDFPSRLMDGLVVTDVMDGRYVSANLPAGSIILSKGNPGKQGVMGLTVRVRMNSRKATAFLTCAHVMSPTIGPTRFEVHNLAGTLVGFGTTEAGFYILNEHADAAVFSQAGGFISNDPGFATLPPGVGSIAGFREVSDSDIESTVYRMNIASGSWVPGVIVSTMADPFIGTGQVFDHLLIRAAQPGPFALQGDSGSAVVSQDGFVVGIIRAVSDEQAPGFEPSKHRTVATRISNVQSLLNVEFPT